MLSFCHHVIIIMSSYNQCDLNILASCHPGLHIMHNLQFGRFKCICQVSCCTQCDSARKGKLYHCWDLYRPGWLWFKSVAQSQSRHQLLGPVCETNFLVRQLFQMFVLVYNLILFMCRLLPQWTSTEKSPLLDWAILWTREQGHHGPVCQALKICQTLAGDISF